MALTAVITDLEFLEAQNLIQVTCDASNDELLFVDWLNAIVYEMATRKMLFCRFEAHIDDGHLKGSLWGQAIEVSQT